MNHNKVVFTAFVPVILHTSESISYWQKALNVSGTVENFQVVRNSDIVFYNHVFFQ